MTFAKDQNRNATAIEDLGKAFLPNGQCLSEFLTIQNIPFWDVFAAEAAWRHLTTALQSKSLIQTTKAFIRPYALRLRDIINKAGRSDYSGWSLPNWPTGRVVLCLGFTPRMYRDVLAPVVWRLTSESQCSVVVLSDSISSTEKFVVSDAVSFQNIWQYWSGDVKEQTHEILQSIRLKEAELLRTCVLDKLFPEPDSELSIALKKVLRVLLKAYIPNSARQAAIAKHILEVYRPSVLLSPDVSDSRTRLYTLLGSGMGIPTMEVQFGLTGDEGVEWRFFKADYVAAWGESSKAAFIKQSVPEQKIIITGSPRHDALKQHSGMRRAEVPAGLENYVKRPLVLLASTYVDWTHTNFSRPEVLLEMKKAVFKAAEKNPNVTLVVKPHPVEITKDTQAMAGGSKNIIFVDRDSDIRDLILICDAFISFGSTATVDAIIAEKVCICPIFPGWPFGESFRKAGVVLVPESQTELEDVFSDISSHRISCSEDLVSLRRNFLDNIALGADGLAAVRIKDHLLEMIR